tara:strand:+ start:385 stop:954 length:570 start_codon:yes stop_codon:yes gene_type:complete
MTTSAKFSDRESLEKAMKELGLWDVPLEMGRLEEGVMAFTAWLPNKDALDVVIKPSSFDEYNELDIYEETSLADLIFVSQLNVRYAKSGINGEVTVFFDSFDDTVFKDGYVEVTHDYKGSATVNSDITYRICKTKWNSAMNNSGGLTMDALEAILSEGNKDNKLTVIERNTVIDPNYIDEQTATVVHSS